MTSILLMNTSFKNRGDALMNEAILRRLGGDHRWSVMASLAALNPRESRPYFKYLDSDRVAGSARQRAFNAATAAAARGLAAAPASVRAALGVVVARDVDLAVDVSGYCFGDHWGVGRVELSTALYRRLRRGGATVVLMPKTWGPFRTIPAKALDAMFEHVDLAFARDRRSEAELRPLLAPAHAAKLHFAPDYTHAVPVDPIVPPGPPVGFLIPSRRVIDSGTMTRDDYLTLFALARARMAASGLRPQLLIHEVSNDLRFIPEAAAMGFVPEDVVVAADALHAKALIAGARAVVTSRLHGLYNALNTAAPVAVVAWSWKYAEALKHYGVERCLVDLADPRASLIGLLDRLLDDEPHRAALLADMRAGKAESARLSEAMWRRIGEAGGLRLC